MSVSTSSCSFGLSLSTSASSVYSKIRPTGIESRPSPHGSYFTRRLNTRPPTLPNWDLWTTELSLSVENESYGFDWKMMHTTPRFFRFQRLGNSLPIQGNELPDAIFQIFPCF